MFDPKDAEQDPMFYRDLKAEIQLECEKLGPTESVRVFENNPEGVVAVKYESSRAAQRCLDVMNARWFGGRQITVDYYDGLSDYVVKESEEQMNARLAKFEEWLEQDEEDQGRSEAKS